MGQKAGTGRRVGTRQQPSEGPHSLVNTQFDLFTFQKTITQCLGDDNYIIAFRMRHGEGKSMAMKRKKGGNGRRIERGQVSCHTRCRH